MEKVNEKFEDFVNEAKTLNTKDINYTAEYENGANNVHFILSETSIENENEGDWEYSKNPRVEFELKAHPNEVVKEYDKVAKFLKRNSKQYKYVMIYIEGQEDSHDGLEFQPIHTQTPLRDKMDNKYKNKQLGSNQIWGNSLIQKEEDIDFQLMYLESRKEIFEAMYKDSLNPNNYEDNEDGQYEFGFVWYAD